MTGYEAFTIITAIWAVVQIVKAWLAYRRAVLAMRSRGGAS